MAYDDSSGERDRGRCLIDPDGDACITWQGASEQHCFKAFVDGDRVSWQHKTGRGEATLRSAVGTGFLKPREYERFEALPASRQACAVQRPSSLTSEGVPLSDSKRSSARMADEDGG